MSTLPRAIATDGTEWNASDMAYGQDQNDNEIKQRTAIHLGAAGVVNGGAVAAVSGLTVSVSGVLTFSVNGFVASITSPANIVLPNNATRYIVAKYGNTENTPATYYGGGSPPDKRRASSPTVVVKTVPAVLNDDEVSLATVVTLSGAISSITDTRVMLPFVSNGNLNMGAGKTVDGVDVSAHVAQIATDLVAGHVLLGAATGAARFEDVAAAPGYWVVEYYIYGRSGSFIPDSTDFSSPPGGKTVREYRDLTYSGTFWKSGFGAEWNLKATLNFSSNSAFSHAAQILAVDDTVRFKYYNGSTMVDLFNRSSKSLDLDEALTVPIRIGTNKWEIYFCNGGGDEYTFHLQSEILRTSGITFNPL